LEGRRADDSDADWGVQAQPFATCPSKARTALF
jgi:hypothetical protein